MSSSTDNTVYMKPHDYISTSVLVSVEADTIVATPGISKALDALRDLERQELALKRTKKQYQDMIKLFMNEHTQLLDIDGSLAATWKQDADKEVLDKNGLRLNFADVYAACVNIEPGSRRFLLK